MDGEKARADAPGGDAAEDRVLDDLEVSQPAQASSFQQDVAHTSRKAHESEVEQRFVSLLTPEAQDAVRASPDIYEVFGKAVKDNHGVLTQAITRQELSGSFFEELKTIVNTGQEELKAMMAKNTMLQETMNAKQEKIEQLQQQALLNQEEMKQLQQQAPVNQEEMRQLQERAFAQLALLQSRVQAVLTETYELHEYPIPRLFVVLPQDPEGWNSVNVLANKFRLYFLCECGEHTKSINSSTKIPHHIHLAKHEGYEIARPSEFFQQYGSYILTILKMLKYGLTVPGVIMPSFSQLISPEVLGQTVHGLKGLQDTIAPGVDQVINWMDNDKGVEGITGQVESKVALEGADLRKLEAFLQGNDGNKVLGNLYRTVTDKGHVKWVCIDHYRENCNQRTVDTFRRAVDSVGGSFDENKGLVKVNLESRTSAELFYSALGEARCVYELDIILEMDNIKSDLEALEYALKKSSVAILQLDLRYSRPSLSSKLSSTSSRYDVLHRIMEHPNMKIIHVVFSKDFMKQSNFQPRTPPHLKKSSFGMTSASFGAKGARALSDMLKTDSMLTTLDLFGSRIEDNGAQALAEALRTNSSLTTLNLRCNLIGVIGTQALAEALKVNSALTTLILGGNNIMQSAAQVLAEALKVNTTLTTLDLVSNLIGANGAEALAGALKSNQTLTTLDLSNNSIGDSGAEALAETLKSNSALTTLTLTQSNIAGPGVQALAGALKINATLASLNLDRNSIDDNGAQALADALRINATLTSLNLSRNLIRDNGARTLAKALKINSSLIDLVFLQNSIGSKGVQSLAEAARTRSTRINLKLEGDAGDRDLTDELENRGPRGFWDSPK
ncbi:hypothetical protein BGZ72_005417 [Mortierella alpina]|nr:hypothetical protein BGZ72_005417 [Mortierella alpina]